jgi:N-acetylglucosaminyl-diphospho-decaprenol L-rhamnosyltransferase
MGRRNLSLRRAPGEPTGISLVGMDGTGSSLAVGGVDAVVVSYRSRDTLRACVEPLCGLDGVSVTVVDNASPDDSIATVEDLSLEIIRSPRNGGFAYGCNLGARVGSAPYVLLLNPDARIDRAALETLVGVLDR